MGLHSHLNHHFEQLEFNFVPSVTGHSPSPRRAEEWLSILPQDAGSNSGANWSEVNPKHPFEASPKHSHQGWQAIIEDAERAAEIDWIESACENIIRTKDLREAITLSASYLSDLIDHDIKARGYSEEWISAYSAYCSIQYYSFAPIDDEELGTPGIVWGLAYWILNTYESSAEMTDWDLFQEFCSEKMAGGDFDEESAEASVIDDLSASVWAVHDIIINGGREVFSIP